MGMQFNTTQIDDPGEPGRIIDHDFLGGPARRERQRDGSQPGRPLGWRAFLIKGFCLGAVDETLENNWTISDSGERAWRNGQIIAHKIEFRDARLRREVQFVGMCYLNITSLDRQYLAGCFFRHQTSLSKESRSVSLPDERRPYSLAERRACILSVRDVTLPL